MMTNLQIANDRRIQIHRSSLNSFPHSFAIVLISSSQMGKLCKAPA
jgi:hypothetical protein